MSLWGVCYIVEINMCSYVTGTVELQHEFPTWLIWVTNLAFGKSVNTAFIFLENFL